MKAATLVKFGGELLEQPDRLSALARMLADTARHTRMVVVHGGGREIDQALARAGIARHQVDGLRVTDPPTMGVVVEVLAGTVNTRLVAAVTTAGGRAVGLSGADAGLAPAVRAEPHVSVDGRTVDLGLVGRPVDDGPPALLRDLVSSGYLPVVCSIGLGADGTLYNVNADTLAGSLAGRLQVRRLVIAGATAGVLDGQGRTVKTLDRAGAEALVGSGVATAGMIAKLRAAIGALAAGVDDVMLVDGRDAGVLGPLLDARSDGNGSWPGTRMVA